MIASCNPRPRTESNMAGLSADLETRGSSSSKIVSNIQPVLLGASLSQHSPGPLHINTTLANSISNSTTSISAPISSEQSESYFVPSSPNSAGRSRSISVDISNAALHPSNSPTPLTILSKVDSYYLIPHSSLEPFSYTGLHSYGLRGPFAAPPPSPVVWHKKGGLYFPWPTDPLEYLESK